MREDKQHKAPSRTMTVQQAAAELGVSDNSAYLAVREGKIPSIRIGKRIVIPRAAFERLLEMAE